MTDTALVSLPRRFARSLWLPAALALVMTLTNADHAEASIFGGVGNDPVNDPGWPAGAAKVFNVQSRVAYWEGPPLGGGQWHGEFRGSAEAFNAVLADFAQIKTPKKRLVVHDGVGASFWLNPNRTADVPQDARLDWMFTVWVPESFERLRDLPADLRAFGDDAEPIPQLDVYTGFNIPWADVRVPEGIEIDDQRLEAHGFSVDDGTVLDGTVTDLGTGQPLAAQIDLQLIEAQETGGYRYSSQAKASTDPQGRWALKSIPAGWYQVVVSQTGFVARIGGHYQFDGAPKYTSVATVLAPAATVSGRILDDQGQPLAGVEVSLRNLNPGGGERYDAAAELKAETGTDGRFAIPGAPVGAASLWLSKSGYVFPGLGPEVKVPSTDNEHRLNKAANLLISVDFQGATPPEEYLVHIEPEGGSQIGSWGGSGKVDVDGRWLVTNVPPGKYVLYGSPNPGSDSTKSEPVTVDLKGGETTKAVVKANKSP